METDCYPAPSYLWSRTKIGQRLGAFSVERYAWAAPAALALLGASLAAGIGIANADNLVPTGNGAITCPQGYPPPHGTCRTDNAKVYWHMASGTQALEPADRTALTNMLTAQFGPTDLTLVYDSTPVFSGSGETDWIYQEGPIAEEGVIGRTWCNDKVSTWVCDQHYIKLEGSGQYFQNPKVTCHETGHAVGLTHGNAAHPVLAMNAASLGCLRAPLSAITSNALGSANVSQINAVY